MSIRVVHLRWLQAIVCGLVMGLSFAEEKTAAPAPMETRKTESVVAKAGATTSKTEQKADEVVVTVTATRAERSVFDVPTLVEVYNESAIREELQITNFVDVFKETPGVSVQKTAQGHGSPFIRGFTGYRNLLLIDGVRYNKSNGRDGPVQYWASIDPLDIQRVELVKGPGSSLYGSDAVGGTVNVLTKGTDTWSDKTEVGGDAYYRFSTAERSNIGHVSIQGSHKDKVGFYFGGSFKDYDDFVAGGGTGVVDNSAYQEYGAHGKLQYRPVDNHELTLVGQYFHQTDVPRTEQTLYAKPFEGSAVGSDYRNDTTNDRYLSYLKYHASKLEGPVNDVEVTLSYQRTGEELQRIRRDTQGRRPRLDDPNALNIDTYGAQLQFKSKVPCLGVMTYGADYYRDDTHSSRKDLRWNRTNTEQSLVNHYQGLMADDSDGDMAGLFIQDEKDLFDGMLTLTAAGRFDYVKLNAGVCEDPRGTTFPPFSIDKDWNSATGSFRFLVRPDHKDGDHWRVFGGIGTSFRAPTIYDVSSFDSGTAFVEYPTADLEPERFLEFEIGTQARYDRVTFGVSYYYTRILDMIQRSPTGAYSSGVPIVEKSSGFKGYVNGIEAKAEWEFVKNVHLWANVTWAEGYTEEYISLNPPMIRNKPLSRLIPVMSHMGLKYEPVKEHWWVELHADFYTDADRLSVKDHTDTRRIPPDGTPGFGVVGIRGGVKLLDDRFTISGAIENIGNVEYRIHGSGQNMPGTNFVLSLNYRW